MHADFYATIKHLYHEALARRPEDRAIFLSHACRGDDALRTQVESLLAHDGQGDFLSTPAAARGVLGATLIGYSLGPYVISARLGEGGMGDVYRARDTKLGRDVAIKVLPAVFSSDPGRLARFEREARVLAALNHPHVGAIYGLEDMDGTPALVLELVDGPTLADRLANGPMSVSETLASATQIADALDAAHQQGIVHRDLKPANVKITPDGVVKVLDFGLAKAAGTENGRALTHSLTMSATGEGIILGTASYMSPEQARGQTVDKRADIWAFGCVVYEMLTGRMAFPGGTLSDTVAGILEHEPDWTALPGETPTNVRRLLQRCLEKSVKPRLRDIGDARSEIEHTISAGRTAESIHSSASARAAVSPVVGRARRDRLSLGVAAAVAGVVLGIVATMFVARFASRRFTEGPPLVARVLVSIAPAEHLQALPADRTTTEGRPSRTAMVWSPDGRTIVFSAVQGDRQQLYRRGLDQLAATPIPGTDGGASPFFSPDGHSVGFWSGGALMKTSVDGSGPATKICDTNIFFGASWGSDDTIIFSRNGEGLWRVSAAGGTAQALTKPDRKKGELKYLLPQILPGGRTVLFTVTHTPLPTWDDTEIVAQSLARGDRTVLVHGGADGRYLSSGHLVYLRRGTLMAVAFDLQHLSVTGDATALIGDVMQAGNTPNEAFDSGAGQFSVSEAGSLLYVPGGLFPDAERFLVWVDRTGREQPLALPARAYLSPRISPDGHRVLLWTQGDRNIWIHDLARGTLTRLTSEARNARAIWTPDGTRVTYGSATAGDENIFWKPADGSGPAERLTTSEYQNAAASWSPDGQTLAFAQQSSDALYDIWVLPMSGDGRVRSLIQTRFSEAYPDFSPDGRWLAYASNESGRYEVYVRPYPGPGPRQQVSAEGGTAPAWSRDGRELFYTTSQTTGGQATFTKMMVVAVALRPTFMAGTPHMLFQGRYGASAIIRGYDVTPDGRRFLMVQQKERPPVAAADMILVQNWLEELKARVPIK